jgi:rubrerythrin
MANLIEKAQDYMRSVNISHAVLRDKLSEFLEVEKGGLKLYEEALRIITDTDISEKFRTFHEQTQKHATILTRVIRALGLDPARISEGAKVARQKAEALLKTMTSDGLSGPSAEINAVENIILAETKDHADWELLGKIARQSDDEQVRDVLRPAVGEVEPEEDEHLNWTKKHLGRLEMSVITTNQNGRARPEDGWLSDRQRRSTAMPTKSSPRKYGKKASEKVKRAMHERKQGTLKSGSSGKKVTSRKQAIAIGLSEARRSGAKVPKQKGKKS